jgi:dihydroorotase
MKLLIKSAQVLDPQSNFHLSTVDILITDGVIEAISDEIDAEDAEIIEGDHLKVSPGWIDMRSIFYDPGEEHKEDLESGSAVAAAAGFTQVLLLPNNQPVADHKGAISYIKKYGKGELVELLPYASVSVNAEGKELTEMIDLSEAGAVAFTDGLHPIWHTDILLKSLQYLQKFDGLLVNRPEDKMLTAFGHMNEGIVSTGLGLKGMPDLAESVMIERDLALLEYAGGRIHFSTISSKRSVELIRDAKARGLRVTCDVGVNYLKFTDDDLETYDTNYKVNPPYRTEEDRLALIEGVLDATIDVIVSDHNPQDEESKKLEFDLAEFGTNNLVGFWPIINEVFKEQIDQVIASFTSRPRSILGLDQVSIGEGLAAHLTVFDEKSDWLFDHQNNLSKSDYSPLFNKEVKGRVKAIVHQGRYRAF